MLMIKTLNLFLASQEFNILISNLILSKPKFSKF